MMRTIDLQTLIRFFELKEDVLLRWISEFGEHFSHSVKAPTDPQRHFTENDLCVLMYIQEQAEDGSPSEEIHGDLCRGEHESDRNVEMALLYTPLFQDMPDEIDETWQHGVLIGGMASRNWLEVARSYKLAGDNLVSEALKTEEPHKLDYPIFYIYRHCLELYLKTILGGTVRGHDFGKLIEALEEKYKKPLGGWIRERLWDFHDIDKKSDMFRYPEEIEDGELWIDFHHLLLVMNRMSAAFEVHLASGK